MIMERIEKILLNTFRTMLNLKFEELLILLQLEISMKFKKLLPLRRASPICLEHLSHVKY